MGSPRRDPTSSVDTMSLHSKGDMDVTLHTKVTSSGDQTVSNDVPKDDLVSTADDDFPPNKIATSGPHVLFPWRRRLVATMLWLGTGISVGGNLYAYGFYIVAMEDEFGWTRTQMNSGLSIGLGSSCAFGLLLGWYVDRHKRHCRNVLVAIQLISAVGFVIRALTDSLGVLYFSMVLSFLSFYSVIFILTPRLVAEWFPDKKSAVMGIVTTGNPSHAFIVTAITESAIRNYGWRNTSWGFAVYFCLIALLSFLIVDSSPAHYAEKVERRRKLSVNDGGGGASSSRHFDMGYVRNFVRGSPTRTPKSSIPSGQGTEKQIAHASSDSDLSSTSSSPSTSSFFDDSRVRLTSTPSTDSLPEMSSLSDESTDSSTHKHGGGQSDSSTHVMIELGQVSPSHLGVDTSSRNGGKATHAEIESSDSSSSSESPSVARLTSQQQQLDKTEAISNQGMTMQEALRWPGFYLLVGAACLGQFSNHSVSSQLTPHFVNVGFSTQTASQLVMVFSIFAIVSKLLSGMLSQRISARSTVCICLMIQIPALGLFIVTGGSDWTWAVTIMYALGLGGFGSMVLVINVDAFGLVAIGKIQKFLLKGLMKGLFVVFGRSDWTSAVTIMYALGLGGFGSMVLVINVDAFGLVAIGKIQGALAVASIIPSVVGPVLSGALFDMTGSYSLAFGVIIGLLGVGVVFVLLAGKSPYQREKLSLQSSPKM